MNSIHEIRNKIENIKNTQQITKAMEMVSKSKIRKSQNRLIFSKNYLENILKIIKKLIITEKNKNIFLQKRDYKNVGYIIISSNKGLCGNLNSNLFKNVLNDIKYIKKEKKSNIHLILIGSKAEYFFNSFNFKILYKSLKLNDFFSLKDIENLVENIFSLYKENKLDRVYIANNKFINILNQKPNIKCLLPLNIKYNFNNKIKISEYLCEPDSLTLMNILLKQYFKNCIYKSILENIASEQSSRIISMKHANDNSDNLIKDLKLIYNKSRQSNITQELTEIIGGASAV